MKRSTEKILTTHTGSLARPAELHEIVMARAQGKPYDIEALDLAVKSAVSGIVKKQVAAGVDVINDGEQSKTNWTAYVNDRLNGFGGEDAPRPLTLDQREFPEYSARRAVGGGIRRLSCVGPLSWKDFAAVGKDIDNLKAAVKDVHVADAFMTAVSPGTVANFHPNNYYPNREAYLQAIADVMKQEYEAVVKAGFVIQFDCPDLALRNIWFPDSSIEEFRKVVAQNIDALNHATRDIPPESMRMHVCWGLGEGPKNHDVPLRDIVDLLLRGRTPALSIVGANARHEFEWKVWKDVKVPAGKVIIPGVIDNTTNIIEHPEVVADRLLNYAGVLGRENIMAGVDCGFTNNPLGGDVDPKICFAKLTSQSEGAALASKELWRR